MREKKPFFLPETDAIVARAGLAGGEGGGERVKGREGGGAGGFRVGRGALLEELGGRRRGAGRRRRVLKGGWWLSEKTSRGRVCDDNEPRLGREDDEERGGREGGGSVG